MAAAAQLHDGNDARFFRTFDHSRYECWCRPSIFLNPVRSTSMTELISRKASTPGLRCGAMAFIAPLIPRFPHCKRSTFDTILPTWRQLRVPSMPGHEWVMREDHLLNNVRSITSHHQNTGVLVRESNECCHARHVPKHFYERGIGAVVRGRWRPRGALHLYMIDLATS